MEPFPDFQKGLWRGVPIAVWIQLQSHWSLQKRRYDSVEMTSSLLEWLCFPWSSFDEERCFFKCEEDFNKEFLEKKELFIAATILEKDKTSQSNEKAKKIKDDYLREKRQRKTDFLLLDPDDIPTIQPFQTTPFQQVFSTSFPTDPRVLVASGYNPPNKGKEALSRFLS